MVIWILKKKLASYNNIKGLFTSPKTFLIVKEMPIHIWWKYNGFEPSNLQKFAIKGLNQVIVVLTWKKIKLLTLLKAIILF